MLCYKNRDPIALIFRKIYLFALYINPHYPLSHRTFQTCVCMSVMHACMCIQSVVVIMSVEAGIKDCMMRCVVSLMMSLHA